MGKRAGGHDPARPRSKEQLLFYFARIINNARTMGVDMKISKRISDIPMSGIRKMFDLAGPDSINPGTPSRTTSPSTGGSTGTTS